ncbi:MAG: ATP-binding protein, partial [Deltaproteobacteria bacterium]|nr:ATP-binding protein [Deltaproteobacteria bacterium]
MKSLKLAGIIENLGQFISLVHACSVECGFGGKRSMEIELAVEEALVNIFNYAYPDGEGQVEMQCGLKEDNKFVIEIRDTGIPFDGLSRPDPDTKTDLDNRKVGGLGIFFIKKMADEVRYCRNSDMNVLT